MADLGGDDISGGEFPFWGPMMSFDSEDWRLDATQQINLLTNSNAWNEQKVSETEVKRHIRLKSELCYVELNRETG